MGLHHCHQEGGPFPAGRCHGGPAHQRAYQGPAGVLGRPDPPARLPRAAAHPGRHRRAGPRGHRRQPPDRHVESAAPPSLILASASPRRRELLSSLCPDFRVVPSEIEETLAPGPHAAAAAALALDKARSVAARVRQGVVLG
ncbi:MAG: hypothetical protein EHM88_08180, partial [Candidatus Rokuibacteriota bacterium]